MTFSTTALIPTLTERLARARADLRMGVPVVICEGDHAVMILAAETLTKQRLATLKDM